MASMSYKELRDPLRQFYLDNPRPSLVGFSGGKDRMRRCSQQPSLIIEAYLLKPKRLKTDPVTALVNERLGHWGESILRGSAAVLRCAFRRRPARRSGRRDAWDTRSTRKMAGREARNGLCH